MIEYLELKHVGPASTMKVDFAPRLSILTGDNGLGKTFIMDIVWFALTGTWSALPALPKRGKGIEPAITFYRRHQEKKDKPTTLSYSYKNQKWEWGLHPFVADGLVLYARADGGVSIWDHAKNTAQQTETQTTAEHHLSSDALHFNAQNIFDGISDKDKVKCNGLIRDWVNWQFQKKELFDMFIKVLEIVSPNSLEIIRPGEPMRISLDDARDIPTVKLPYGNTPVTHVSAGMRRILSLAYLMVWSWNEHLAASNLINQEPSKKFVILFDEIEAHLHPQWQRSFMPALLEVVRLLETNLDVQIIASAHAPLVLASLETQFCEDSDKILNFQLTKDSVLLKEIPWAKQGDVVNWLVSDTFGLQQARSRDAEMAIEAAEAFMRNDIKELPKKLKTKKDIHNELMRVLPGHDMFWPRWLVKTGEKSS